MLVAMVFLSILPSQAEPGISIVSSTASEQSHLLATIGRIEVSMNTISLVSKDGVCLATEPIDKALKIIFNTYSSESMIDNDSNLPLVRFSDQTDIVYVQNFDSSCVVRIYSLSGVLVMQQALPQGCGEVDCSGIPAGYYILQVGTRVIKIYKK